MTSTCSVCFSRFSQSSISVHSFIVVFYHCTSNILIQLCSIIVLAISLSSCVLSLFQLYHYLVVFYHCSSYILIQLCSIIVLAISLSSCVLSVYQLYLIQLCAIIVLAISLSSCVLSLYQLYPYLVVFYHCTSYILILVAFYRLFISNCYNNSSRPSQLFVYAFSYFTEVVLLRYFLTTYQFFQLNTSLFCTLELSCQLASCNKLTITRVHI